MAKIFPDGYEGLEQTSRNSAWQHRMLQRAMSEQEWEEFLAAPPEEQKTLIHDVVRNHPGLVHDLWEAVGNPEEESKAPEPIKVTKERIHNVTKNLSTGRVDEDVKMAKVWEEAGRATLIGDESEE